MHRLHVDFSKDTRGGVVLIVAMLLPVLVGLSAAAVEYGSLIKRRAELQRAADSGSISGVNQFKLANSDDASAIRAAVAMARAQAGNERPVAASAEVLDNHSSVRVTLSETVVLTLGRLVNMHSLEIRVQSTARLAGTTRLCLLALEPFAPGAFHLENGARLTAPNCTLYSNSIDPASLQGEDDAVARTLVTCSAGGYSGRANFTPPPVTGCPTMLDPLIARPAPPTGLCINLGMFLNPQQHSGRHDDPAYGRNVVSTTATLSPGTYCGGLHITKRARVFLQPGVYVMKDGPLVVDQGSSLTGTHVGVYFTGVPTWLLFDEDSTISLTAPKEPGPMQGLLFFEDRSVLGGAAGPVGTKLHHPEHDLQLPPPLDGKGLPKDPPGGPQLLREYRIISNDARTLLGTIYLPAGRLIIDSKKPIANQSAYTVIIARLINLYDGPNLVLNAQYGSSDVPVPKGVGPSSASTELTQ